MAKYIVEDSYKPSYEKNYKLPLINIIPAVVWSIPVHQKLFPDAGWWATFGLCALFVIVYVTLSYLPIIVAVPGIAGVIIFTALFWVFADYIGNSVVRIIVKILIAAFFGFMELAIFANATVPWLEGKEANKPRIRVEK
ncbi:hypothetical protein [Lacrimispora sp.]|uniref:hypothetical protein n=1 Tax=Lacrimispora sp. TaxID=2719234 RepID=UPI003995A1E1